MLIGVYLTVIWSAAMIQTAWSSGSTSPASASHNRYALPSSLSYVTTDRLICGTVVSRWTHGTARPVPLNMPQKRQGPSPDPPSEQKCIWIYGHIYI